jgi:methionine synthase II (cobalamin-independent)
LTPRFGECTRIPYHTDFQCGLPGVKPVPDGGFVDKLEIDQPYICDELGFNPVIAHVKYLVSVVPEGAVAKFNIPGIGFMFAFGPDPAPKPYKGDIDAFVVDIVNAYSKTILAFYAQGLRYLQIDECAWTTYCQAFGRAKSDGERQGVLRLAKLNLETTNKILANLPKDLTVTVHTCRGNYASAYICDAPYDDTIDAIFGQLNVDALFLEFDDARSGDVAALATFHKANPKLKLILGVVSTKKAELEKEADVIAKIQAAAKFCPLELLGISGQCGFASCEAGQNKLSDEEQWAKVKFWVAVAKKVWADA